MPSSVLFIGASRGCGLFSALVFVKSSESHRAAFLLRKPATLEANADYKALTDGQRARCTLLTGDATKLEDVERAIDAVSGLDGIVDSLGGVPTMTWHGFDNDQPNITESGMRNILTALHRRPHLHQVRLVTVSSMGLDQAGYTDVPLLIKPIYGYLLHYPHADKLAMETLAWHASGHRRSETSDLPSDWLPDLVVVRPALLTDGAETAMYRAAERLSCYSISRRDVGHFIATQALGQEDAWRGKAVVVGY